MKVLPRSTFFALALAVQTAAPSSARADAPRTSASAPAQDLVARGQALFDDQRYEESIEALSAALLRPDAAPARRIEIYRLLALDYITLSRPIEGEAAVRGLLALSPRYALPETESPRFRDFFASVRSKWEAEGRPGLVKEAPVPLAPVRMRHVSPSMATAHEQIDLVATLEDPAARVKDVRLFYRTGSSGSFALAAASLAGSRATASIPPGAVTGPVVEYYLEGRDGLGAVIVSRGDATAPLRIPVPEDAPGWILPAAIGGGVLGAAAIVGVLAAAGVFKSTSGEGHPAGPNPSPGGQATVNVSVGSSGFGARW